jgi:hypothetical protein
VLVVEVGLDVDVDVVLVPDEPLPEKKWAEELEP